jgi:hypothetical protein
MTETKKRRIACIGWGSLIWDPRTLAYQGDWNLDGPMLPVEFARESDGQKITLVICPDAARMKTRWVVMRAIAIDAAKQNLGLREYDKATPKWISTRIGFWDRERGAMSGREAETIAAWGMAKDLDGAVWTDLPFGFKASPETMPTGEQVVAHLKALVGEQRAKAEEYICRAPEEVETAYRRLIEKTLDWAHRP